MELSQFKGAAEIGAIVRHVGDVLTSGERLLPADGSTVNSGIYPQLAAKVKTNVKPIKVTSSIGQPLLNSASAITRARFPVASLANNYVLFSGTNGGTFSAQEASGGSRFDVGDIASVYYGGRPAVSANRQKKVLPMTDGNGLLQAMVTITGLTLGSFSTRRSVSGTGEASGNACPALMRADGSLCYIFASSGAQAGKIAGYSSPLTAVSGPWTALPLSTPPAGSNWLSGEAYGNETLSLMVLGSGGSLLKSTDNAVTWSRKIPNPENSSTDLVGLVAHADGLTSLCRQNQLLFITSDGWETWRTIQAPPPPEGAEWVTLASAGIEEGSRNIYALYRVALLGSTGYQLTHYLIRSTDHGETWSDPIVQPGLSISASVSLYEGPLLIPANPTYLYAVGRTSSEDSLYRIDISQGKILPFQAGWKIVADRV